MFSIPIPSDEPFYPTQPSPQCMAFTRSEPAILVRGPREHMNDVTHFLDASMLYSSDSCKSTKLRKANHFMFEMEDNKPRKDLLPLCMLGECRAADNQCFIAGDVRVNEQPGLTTYHTLLFREHNHISGKLSTINPNWSTEKVFQGVVFVSYMRCFGLKCSK